MQAIELLKNYKKIIEPRLKGYFDVKINKAAQVDPLAKEAIKMIADFTLADGKRLRPAVVYYAYLAAGGKDHEAIIEASMSIELVHTFLLIHDDIIDRDQKRHGVLTMHERYKKIGRNLSARKDTDHFGNSMAMIAGDMAASMANEIIFNSRFSPQVIIKALDKLQQIVYVTIPGEMLDVVLEMKGWATEDEILRMHEGKTARYTFEGPIHLGSLLAERNQFLEEFSRYSLAVGTAFQIRDDILGVFGKEKKLGKPVGSDIIEGKQTLLVVKALEHSDKKQKEQINNLLGKRDLKKKDLELFRKIITDTGALRYSEELAASLVGDALAVIEKISFENQEAKSFFEGIAKYIIEREK